MDAGDAPLDFCARAVRAADYDRYLTTLFAPTDARAALLALYAFNLEIARIREHVSEPLLGEVRLQFWRDVIGEIYAGRPRPHQVALALATVVQAHDLPRESFDRLIDARAFDLEDDPPVSLGALESYADETSATLIVLALRALGVADEAVAGTARHVGIAWALIGLIRALSFHAGQNRLYLPQEVMAQTGVREADILTGRFTPELGEAVRTLSELARRHRADAHSGRTRVPRVAVPALLPAVLCELYRSRLARTGYNPFDPRLRISGLRRQVALTLAAWRGRY